MVVPKLSLSVELSLSLSLSQNFACHSKFRVYVRKPAEPLRAGAYFIGRLRSTLCYIVRPSRTKEFGNVDLGEVGQRDGGVEG